MSGNFDDLETTVRKSSVIQERMSLVSSHMYKQFLEYQQSNANTAVLFERMVENMALTVEYLKQSFTVRGIPSENIYYEYDKQRHIAIMNILWHSITFYSNMKDKPKVFPLWYAWKQYPVSDGSGHFFRRLSSQDCISADGENGSCCRRGPLSWRCLSAKHCCPGRTQRTPEGVLRRRRRRIRQIHLPAGRCLQCFFARNNPAVQSARCPTAPLPHTWPAVPGQI